MKDAVYGILCLIVVCFYITKNKCEVRKQITPKIELRKDEQGDIDTFYIYEETH